MNLDKVKISLYGESFKIHSLEVKNHFLSLEFFTERALQLGEPLDTALLNINFFKNFSSDKLNSVQDLIGFTFGGLLNNHKAKIEIRRGRKLLQKLPLDDLYDPKTLFPLFDVHKGTLSLKLKNNIFLIEKEIGLIGTYEIQTEKFDIAKLKFNICDVEYNNDHYHLLLALSYNQNKLNSIKSDTLVTSRYCVNHLNMSK